MRRKHYFVIGILSLVLGLASGCRTSQQTRRNNAANGRGTAGQASARQMDSLYMVQDKLLSVIDTMAGIVAEDRARIRSLEIEIAKLKSYIEQQNISGAIPPPAPPLAIPQNNSPQPQSY